MCDHNRDILHDGELVCGKCGEVHGSYQEGIFDTAEVTASGHGSTEYLKLTKLGTSHDYKSPTNKGGCFELNNPRGKDYEGKKITMLLSDPYTTGQVVEKGSVAFTDEEGKTRAKKPITDDTTYRKAMQKAYQLAIKYGLDRVAQMYLERKILKNFQENISNSEWIALKAFLETEEEYPGLNIHLADEIMPDYLKVCNKIRDTLMRPLKITA